MSKATTHFVKCAWPFFQSVKDGIKKFELRYDDRKYDLGDYVHMMEIGTDGQVTGESVVVGPIKYIMYGPTYGLKKGWVIFNW